MEISPLLCETISCFIFPCDSNFSNIQKLSVHLTLKTLSPRPRTQYVVSFSQLSIMHSRNSGEGEAYQRLPAPPAQPLLINHGKHGAGAHTLIWSTGYFLSNSLSQTCVSC